MAQFEFTAPAGATYTGVLYNPLSNYASLATGISISEVAPTLYRASTVLTGIVYLVATAGSTKTVGFVNLNVPHSNGYSEVFDTYEEATNAGMLPTILASTSGLVVPTINQVLNPGEFTVHITTDCTQNFTITVPADWVKIYFNAKLHYKVEDDTQSILQLLVTNPANAGTDGLTLLNKVATTKSNGSLAVAPDRSYITLTLKAAATSALSEQTCYYDFKIIRAATVPYTTDPAKVFIKPTVTRAIT